MTGTMDNKLALDINDEILLHLEPIARDFAVSNGIVFRDYEVAESCCVNPAPFTILPSPFPRRYFQQAVKVQKDFNLLYHKVACDYNFLKTSLEQTIKCDDFIARLWSIYEKVRSDGVIQPIFIGLNRSDYMLDQSKGAGSCAIERAKLMQVEFNLMASSFGGLAKRLVTQHRTMTELSQSVSHMFNDITMSGAYFEIPDNEAAAGLAKGLFEAWKLYNNDTAAIMFVVLPNETNIFDQRIVEHYIYMQSSHCLVIHKTLYQLSKCITVTDDHRLMVDEKEVGLVYFRGGYIPSHYADQGAWDAKLSIERSRAIKCPCIQYMLANTNKIQQCLTDPSVVRRYLGGGVASERVLDTFTGQYTLHNTEVVNDALANPDKYVLKPQREGGGNNYYNRELATHLTKILHESTDMDGYILMERIQPFTFFNYGLQNGKKTELAEMVSELGIFGVFIGAGEKKVYANFECGYLLRSKPVTSNEGGVAAGYSYLDIPYLVDP